MTYDPFTIRLAAAYQRRGTEALKGLSKQLRDKSVDAKFAARPGLKQLTEKVQFATSILENDK